MCVSNGKRDINNLGDCQRRGAAGQMRDTWWGGHGQREYQLQISAGLLRGERTNLVLSVSKGLNQQQWVKFIESLDLVHCKAELVKIEADQR